MNLFLPFPQDVSVVEQERIDQIMIDLDGTDNKCKCDFYNQLLKPLITIHEKVVGFTSKLGVHVEM